MCTGIKKKKFIKQRPLFKLLYCKNLYYHLDSKKSNDFPNNLKTCFSISIQYPLIHNDTGTV